MKLPVSALLSCCLMISVSGCADDTVKLVPEDMQIMKKQPELNPTKPAGKLAQQSEGTEQIRALQKRLSEKGYYDGPINGIMTPETRQAAKGELRDRL